MYPYLLFLHSIFRWLVLISLLYAIYRGFKGWRGKLPFTGQDDSARKIAASLSHLQLTLGYILYFYSPAAEYFRTNFSEAAKHFDYLFYGLIHIALMTTAIVLITLGSSFAARKETGPEKFRVMTIFFSLALVIMFIAVPWPFSPLINRPYLRPL